MTIKEPLQHKLIELGGGAILIHADIRQGFEIPFTNKESCLASHIGELMSLCANRSIWMPTFNFDFVQKGKTFDVKNCPSQVGVLPEYFRKNIADWRTPIPVFSFAGIGEQPKFDISGIIDPFDCHSAWNFLYEKNALVMHYGSTFNSATILHYVERISNCLSYRYDKLFYGKIVNTYDHEIDVKLIYHVRPLGKSLVYDVVKIENELLENSILFLYKDIRSRILLYKVRDLVNFCINKMRQNPLYFLDNETKMWVEPLLNKLGRPFMITDFETLKEL